MATAPTLDLGPLRRAHRGPVVAPGDDGWDAARTPYNLAVDQRPAAVAMPESADDVAAAIAFARGHGLGVRMQNTGHGALDDLDGVLLVNASRMAAAGVDAGARTARASAGTRWGQVVGPASDAGLSPLSGTSPTVGVLGYTLGGGLGWLGRRHGLACNSVTAAEVVTADGRTLRVDAGHEPDLFWALRGGGGGFAAVTALELRLYEVPSLVAGNLFWPIERAPDVLPAYVEWTRGLPDTVTSVSRLLRLPPLPMIPEPLRGGAFVEVGLAVLGSEAEAADLLRPLRDLGPALLDTVQPMPPAGLAAVHGDPEDPVPALSEHGLVDDLPAAAIEAILETAGPAAETHLLAFEVRHLGGALAEDAPGHGALGALDGRYLWFALGIPMGPEVGAALGAELAGLPGALAPYGRGRHYQNFAERRVPGSTLFPPEAHERLVALRRAWDPDGVFRPNHPLEG